jgi:hypothetical protein
MALAAQGGALRVVGGALGTGQECCCGGGGGQPTTCACIDWCCVRPALSINGNTLPYKTLQEWSDGPKPCECTFSVTCISGYYAQLSFEYNDPESPVNYSGGVVELICGGDPAASRTELQFFRFSGGGSINFGWYGTAPIIFDCNGGQLSVGEWTTLFCQRDGVRVDPALEPESCEPPATIVFGGTFPCNPLP